MAPWSLDQRRREAEWMDEPGVDPELLRRSLGYIRGINRWLGYTRATLSHLERFSRNWRPGERVTILDVATGSGDVPAALLRWGDRRGFDLRIVGLDLHGETLREAQRREADARVTWVRADATNLPFAGRSFDYVLTSMFLHHLDDDVIVGVFAEMNRVTRRGVIAADLIRARRALMWISLFSLAANPMVRHDAIVSVRQAFTEAEITDLARRGGLGYTRYSRHFGHRFVLSGEREA